MLFCYTLFASTFEWQEHPTESGGLYGQPSTCTGWKEFRTTTQVGILDRCCRAAMQEGYAQYPEEGNRSGSRCLTCRARPESILQPASRS